jgi:hypothetical protein
LFTDGRFTIQAKEEAPGFRVHIRRGALLEAIGEHLRKKVRPKVAVSPSRLTLTDWKALKKSAGKNVKWKDVDGIVDKLRYVKDSFEIDQIRHAARLGSERLPPRLATGCAGREPRESLSMPLSPPDRARRFLMRDQLSTESGKTSWSCWTWVLYFATIVAILHALFMSVGPLQEFAVGIKRFWKRRAQREMRSSPE